MAETNSQIKKKILALIIGIVAATAIAWLIHTSQFVLKLENDAWDRRLQYISSNVKAEQKIRLIMIDQSSLDHFAYNEKQVWPWPRQMYEPVIRFLQKGGAKAVAFDILYTEPSSYGVDDDLAFADSMQCDTKVVIALALRNANLTMRTDQLSVLREKQLRQNKEDNFVDRFLSLTDIPHFPSATLPIPELLERCHAVGNVSSSPDSDGIFRHAMPGGMVNGIPVLNLPFALYNVGVDQKIAAQDLSDRFDQEGRLTVKFAKPGSYPTDSIKSVIQSYVQIESGEKPLINPDEYKDALVLVGMDAPGLLDLRPIPLAKIYPGVEFNATVLDNLIHNSFVINTPDWAAIVLCLILCLLISLSIFFVPGLANKLLAATVIILTYVAIAFQVANHGYWISMATPIIVSILSMIYCLSFEYQLEGKQLQFLRHAFKHYVSPEVIKQIVDNPSKLAIGGERRELTIFFSDIQGFTTISESLDATKLVSLLNEFLSTMSQIILETGGTVDKYVGDAIVAFWNAPVPVVDHPARAITAALKCQEQLALLRERFFKIYGVKLYMRIGIHTGVVSVGNFGSKDRFNYTVVGDAANLASRLEGANKNFGTYMLFSEDTAQAAGISIKSRKVADIVVVGRTKPTSVYEPLPDNISSERIQELDQFNKALKLFEAKDLNSALTAFQAIPKDPVALRYVSRIERDMKKADSSNIWSHVWNLTEK